MRKISIFLSCFLIISLSITSYAQKEERYPRIGFIKSDCSNIRAGDNLNFEVLCQVSNGDKVKVLEKRYKWYKILLPQNACAFIKKEYVSSDNGIGIINANNVNVRAKPGTDFTIIGQLNKEDKVKIIEELEEWYKIQPSKNFIGWIHSDLITFTPHLLAKTAELTTKGAGFTPLKRKTEILVEKREEGLEEKTSALNKNVIDKTQEPFIVRGKLLGTGRLINRPGTHKLMLGSKDFCYLKSEKVDLNKFINLSVEIEGKVIETKGDKPYLISVESVEHIR